MAKKGEFLEYKGRPLVRCGNTIYYGSMADPFVVCLKVQSEKKQGDQTIADKVIIQVAEYGRADLAQRAGGQKERKDRPVQRAGSGCCLAGKSLKEKRVIPSNQKNRVQFALGFLYCLFPTACPYCGLHKGEGVFLCNM